MSGLIQKCCIVRLTHSRVYRTGDLVRLLHDGTFDFLGRVDDQVKLRGQRLEIGEINEIIKTGINGVREIATLVLQHPKQQKEQLVSFVVLKTPTQQRNSEIQLNPLDSEIATKILNACRAKLPGYMIPTHFVAIQSIPLSANNKADAKQLRQIYKSLSLKELHKLSSTGNSSNRPSTDKETKLLKILSKATSVSLEDIDTSSNIFELGLDSISVIRFAHLLKAAGFGNAQASIIMKCRSRHLAMEARADTR
jgi:ferricrocin synthase